MRISVELVPRGREQVYADALEVKAIMPKVTDLNIPDLTQFELRSWHACGATRQVIETSIPHIRAIDIAPGAEKAMGDTLLANGLREILVVRGDPPHDLSRRTYPNTSEDVIRRLKGAFPELRIYAAFDPYRRGFREEMEAVRRKIAAGADGFFTQPMFDLNLLQVCADMLKGLDVFWGIAPVLGRKSRAYWETTNNVLFPSHFDATMEWNRNFAMEALAAARALGGNAYLMPIRVKLATYLAGLA